MATCVMGRPLKWTDEELGGVIERIFEKHGRVTPGLIAGEVRGAYDALFRRVKKGEFNSLREAIGKMKQAGLSAKMKLERQKDLIQWVLDSTGSDKIAKWITRRAEQKDSGLILDLKMLLESAAKSEIEWAFKRISMTVIAKRIVVEFLKTVAAEDRKKLMSLIR